MQESLYQIAATYAGLGEKDRAFEWLEKAYDERSDWLVNLKVEQRFEGLRSDPRFADLLRRYAPSGNRVLGIPTDPEFLGWRAHLAVLNALQKGRCVVPIP